MMPTTFWWKILNQGSYSEILQAYDVMYKNWRPLAMHQT